MPAASRRSRACRIAIPDGAALRAGRSVRLRQVDAAAHDRRAGDRSSAGTVSIDGKVVNAIGPTERDIAMVFQNYALYPHMKVYDNMAYGLRNRGMPKDEIDSRVRDDRQDAGAVARCSTAGRASFPAASASASPWAAPSCATRRSSCSTSRSPISTPSCAARCGSRSRTCSARSASPSVYVTHDQLEAMTLADLLVVMNAGLGRADRRPARHLREAGLDLRRELHRRAADEPACR